MGAKLDKKGAKHHFTLHRDNYAGFIGFLGLLGMAILWYFTIGEFPAELEAQFDAYPQLASYFNLESYNLIPQICGAGFGLILFFIFMYQCMKEKCCMRKHAGLKPDENEEPKSKRYGNWSSCLKRILVFLVAMSCVATLILQSIIFYGAALVGDGLSCSTMPADMSNSTKFTPGPLSNTLSFYIFNTNATGTFSVQCDQFEQCVSYLAPPVPQDPRPIIPTAVNCSWDGPFPSNGASVDSFVCHGPYASYTEKFGCQLNNDGSYNCSPSMICNDNWAGYFYSTVHTSSIAGIAVSGFIFLLTFPLSVYGLYQCCKAFSCCGGESSSEVSDGEDKNGSESVSARPPFLRRQRPGNSHEPIRLLKPSVANNFTDSEIGQFP